MRTHMIQQYKKIKNSPMRSPSPDYACRNHTSRTTMPLEQTQLSINTNIKNQVAPFPHIPIELIKKKRNSEIENVNPKGSNIQKNNSTAAQNSELRRNQPQPSVSDFGVESMTSVSDIFKKIEQIFRIINPHGNSDEFCTLANSMEKLEQIKKQIWRLHEIQYKQEIFAHTQTLKTQNQSFNTSPNKLERDESLSVFQINLLTDQNMKLKRQVTSLRLELMKNEQKCQQRNLSEEVDQDSVKGNSVYQFFRQKITYLETELQNKINMIALTKQEKDQQIRLLKEKIEEKSELLRNQMQRSRRLLTENKEQSQNRRSRQDFLTQSPSRAKIRPDLLKQKNDQLFGERKGLPWEKSSIMSIDGDGDQHDSSIFSEVERVEWDQFLSAKREIINIRNHYEQIVISNAIKYHQILQNMQAQLTQLRNYVAQFDAEQDSGHGICPKCQEAAQNLIKKDILLSEIGMKTGLLEKQVQQANKQNAKLRDLLQKALNQELEAKSSRKKVKGRGLEKVSKKSIKSSDCNQRKAEEKLLGSQMSENSSQSDLNPAQSILILHEQPRNQ